MDKPEFFALDLSLQSYDTNADPLFGLKTPADEVPYANITQDDSAPHSSPPASPPPRTTPPTARTAPFPLLAGEDRMSSTSMESFTQGAASFFNCFRCHNTQAVTQRGISLNDDDPTQPPPDAQAHQRQPRVLRVHPRRMRAQRSLPAISATHSNRVNPEDEHHVWTASRTAANGRSQRGRGGDGPLSHDAGARHGAKEKGACTAAYTAYKSAIDAEKAGHLREARETLRTCAEATACAGLAPKCAAKYTQLGADMPSIVPIVADDTGTPRADVEVRMDGQMLTSKLDGKGIPVEPGPSRADLQRGR